MTPTVEQITQLVALWDPALQHAFRWLRKDGLESGLYSALSERAPTVTLAVAEQLGLVHFAEYVAAKTIDDPVLRAEHLLQHELDADLSWVKAAEMIRSEDLPLFNAWITHCTALERELASLGS